MSETKIEFTRLRETKNTVVFEEVNNSDERDVIGKLYIKKSIAGNAEKVIVTLEL